LKIPSVQGSILNVCHTVVGWYLLYAVDCRVQTS